MPAPIVHRRDRKDEGYSADHPNPIGAYAQPPDNQRQEKHQPIARRVVAEKGQRQQPHFWVAERFPHGKLVDRFALRALES
jgi:hypothetical protein